MVISVTCPKCGLKQLSSPVCKSCGKALGGPARPQIPQPTHVTKSTTPPISSVQPEVREGRPQIGEDVSQSLPPSSYAGFWRRFAAAFIDGIILWISGFIIGIVFGALIAIFLGIRGTDITTIKKVAGINIYILGIVLNWLYYTLLESSSKQATLGKMALGIVVTDLDGSRVSFRRANGRYWGKIVSGIILMIGFIMVGFTERKQGLHDIMAGCLVLKK